MDRLLKSAAVALVAAVAGPEFAAADQPLKVRIEPEDGTQFAIQCEAGGKSVIEHAGAGPQVFGFDEGPVNCRVRIVGKGGIEIEAKGPESLIRSSTSGENSVVTFTLR